MPVAVRPHALVAAVAALALAALLALGTTDASAAKRTCDISGKEQNLGATYVTSLKVARVTCAKGQRVVKAFHKCRRVHGRAGRCGHRVKGFKCTEHRYNKIATEYDSNVTCKNGRARVWHTYTMFT
jgi:hypothetical protein